MRSEHLIVLVAMAATACDKGGATTSASPEAGTTSSAAVDAGASAAPTTRDAGAATTATATAGGSFKGSYTAKPAALYIPADNKDYASVKQAKSDDTTLVGDGTLALAIAGDRVTGTIDSGPASPAVIDATLAGDEVRGTVRRKTPEDQGLTGVIVGKLEGGKVTGTLTLAEGNAAILRDATFTASK